MRIIEAWNETGSGSTTCCMLVHHTASAAASPSAARPRALLHHTGTDAAASLTCAHVALESRECKHGTKVASGWCGAKCQEQSEGCTQGAGNQAAAAQSPLHPASSFRRSSSLRWLFFTRSTSHCSPSSSPSPPAADAASTRCGRVSYMPSPRCSPTSAGDMAPGWSCSRGAEEQGRQQACQGLDACPLPQGTWPWAAPATKEKRSKGVCRHARA